MGNAVTDQERHSMTRVKQKITLIWFAAITIVVPPTVDQVRKKTYDVNTRFSHPRMSGNDGAEIGARRYLHQEQGSFQHVVLRAAGCSTREQHTGHVRDTP